MLIGIDASRANKKHRTGTEWYAFYVIKWLVNIDKKNNYLLYLDHPPQDDLLVIAQAPNVKIKILKWPFNYLWTQGRLSLEMIFCRPGILFVPAHALPIIHPRKSVVTIHDVGFVRSCQLYDYSQQIGPENKRRRKFLNFLARLFTGGKYGANARDYLGWSTEYSLKHAQKIITVSNFSKQEIINIYKTKEDKVKVVYNGYDDYLYQKISDQKKVKEVLEKYDIVQPYFLYIGRLDKKKNTPALIEAFSIMRDKNKELKHKLVLVGAASFGYDEINYMVDEFDLEEEVMLPGWIKEEDIPYLYQGADAFIFPSLYEGFGIPLLEAMACETPIIASKIASIQEVAGEAALLFNPRDLSSMAEAMIEIVINNQLRKKLIQAGAERVKNFSWKKCATETLKEIEDM